MRKTSKYLLLILIFFISNITTYTFATKQKEIIVIEKDNEKYLLFLEETLLLKLEHSIDLIHNLKKEPQAVIKFLDLITEIESQKNNNEKNEKLFIKLIDEINSAIKSFIKSE